MRLSFLLLGLALGSPALAGSIGDPICTDRPGKGSATCAAPKGHWQVEASLADWTLTRSAGQRNRELELGGVDIKYGLTEHAHVEVELPAYLILTSRSPAGHARATGFDDLTIKVKQEVTLPSANLTAALYPFIKLPTAAHDIGNGKVEGGLVVPVAWQLGKSPWSLAASPEVDAVADADGHGHHAAMVQVVSLGWAATANLNLSAELWGQWDWDPAGTTRQASADASAALRLNPNLQLDGGANIGLNRNTPDIEFYAGVSARF